MERVYIEPTGKKASIRMWRWRWDTKKMRLQVAKARAIDAAVAIASSAVVLTDTLDEHTM